MSLIEVESLSWAFVSLISGTLLRSTILAAACGLLLWVFRVKAAEIRHLLWRAVLVALLVLPVLQIVTPPLRRASQVVWQVESTVIPTLPQGKVSTGQAAQNAPESAVSPEASRGRYPWFLTIVAVYVLVTFGFLARLAAGLFRLKWVMRESEFIADASLRRLAHEIWLQNGAGLKPRVRLSAKIVVPVAVEFGEVEILLPHSWVGWGEEKLRAVMMHEMAHVARGDPSTAFLASLASCLFWFHPLSWFLQRQLIALAEEACDEIALRTVSGPERYAHILMDFAKDVARERVRMLGLASAAVHEAQIKKRLERVFAVSGRTHKRQCAMRTLLVAALFPAIYVTAAARFGGTQAQNEPEVLKTGQNLLDSLQAGNAAQFTQELVQVIRHDPDSKLTDLTWVVMQSQGQMSTPENIEAVKSAWQQWLAEHPNSPGAHWGLGICIERSDPERALTLFRRARELSGSSSADRYFGAIAAIYSAAVMTDLHLDDPKFRLNDIAMSLNTATKLRSELESSSDPALLSHVGTTLVSLSSSPGQDAQSELGLDYLRRAVDLDPANEKWKEALEAAKAEPARRRAFAALREGAGTPAGTVRIGAGVATANLIKKVDPQYPPLARQARIQGTVEFNVVIGADG